MRHIKNMYENHNFMGLTLFNYIDNRLSNNYIIKLAEQTKLTTIFSGYPVVGGVFIAGLMIFSLLLVSYFSCVKITMCSNFKLDKGNNTDIDQLLIQL